jgi:hypothetical protein
MQVEVPWDAFVSPSLRYEPKLLNRSILFRDNASLLIRGFEEWATR